MKHNNKHLKISDDIKHLNIKSIEDNLFSYDYHSKYLKRLQKSDIDKEDQHYISTYNSFVGEVYENIIYELLLKYALSNNYITKFILKGPHQNHYKNLKSGLMMDSSSQIVYKAGYKDVTEFDALFFTKNSVCFVESTIVKTTTSLRKRLKKKKALLEVLFPKLEVTALIILSKGALGVNVFPSYCTIWITDPLENEKLIYKIIHDIQNIKPKFITHQDSKLFHTHDIKVENFRYFDTLSWIIKTSRKNSKYVIDFSFLLTDKLLRYFKIFSKLYIGHMNSDTFVQLLKYFNITTISEDIPLENIHDDQIIITIEKTKDSFILVYYLKIINGSLKKLEINGESLIVSNKDPKGFTAAEIKYMKYIFKKAYKLSLEDIKNIETTKDKL